MPIQLEYDCSRFAEVRWATIDELEHYPLNNWPNVGRASAANEIKNGREKLSTVFDDLILFRLAMLRKCPV